MLQVLMGIGIYFAVALPIAIMIGKRQCHRKVNEIGRAHV